MDSVSGVYQGHQQLENEMPTLSGKKALHVFEHEGSGSQPFYQPTENRDQGVAVIALSAEAGRGKALTWWPADYHIGRR
jgi:hypothetical protein